MDVALAKQYHKKLAEFLSELQNAKTQGERRAIATRMLNLVGPLYTVHTGAAQHLEEALRVAGFREEALVKAALYTIKDALQTIHETIQKHPDQHFVLQATERLYARPVVGDELRSAVEKGRLLHEEHAPYLVAFAAPRHVEETFITASPELLREVFEHMGFTDADAILFFRTKAVPRVAHQHEQVPSLTVCKLRAGIPVHVVKHRTLFLE